MKKNYVKPVLQVTAIESTCILSSSSVKSVGTNLTSEDIINLGGGSSNMGATPSARTKGRGLWGDEDDWED